ncbi:IucA/IucC family protein [Streptomyces albireticuli]|uniref:IucA/IucC family protein n=1 Tax=Streptomyces albireticuli TaxID=1940 RepID=UPI00368062B9
MTVTTTSPVAAVPVTDEEHRMLAHLAAHHPERAAAYPARLPRAARGTMTRLLAALLREEVRPSAGARTLAADPSGEAGALLGREALDVLTAEGATGVLLLPVTDGTLLAVGVIDRSTLRRTRTTPTVCLITANGRELVGHPVTLLTALTPLAAPGHRRAWQEFTAEVADSVANLALSHTNVDLRSEALAATARRLGARDAGELLALLGRDTDADDINLLADGLCAEGHNIHPCGRVRKGMLPEENHLYAAENAGRTGLRLVAVRTGHTLATPDPEGREADEILAGHFPALYRHARRELTDRGLDPDDFRVYPVHPWQADHTIPTCYAAQIAEGTVVLLPDAVLPARPTASVRSVVTEPGAYGRRLVVKTSLDVLLTSTRRNISPASTRNGPAVSRILTEIFAAEPGLARRARPVRELAGLSFASDSPGGPELEPGRGDALRRNLSLLLREGLSSHVAPGESALSGCALFARSPVTGRTVLADLVVQYARARDIGHLEAARAVLRDYLGLLLPVTLTLMVAYGIALESHLQNTVVVFRDGRPVRLLLRDFAGMRLHAGRLREAGVAFDPHPGSVTVTSDPAKLHDRFCYAVLRANVTEFVGTLAEEFALPEEESWRATWEEAERAFAELAGRPGLALRAGADRAAISAPALRQKMFVRMRLEGDAAGELYQRVDNPLHRAAGAPSVAATDH